MKKGGRGDCSTPSKRSSHHLNLLAADVTSTASSLLHHSASRIHFRYQPLTVPVQDVSLLLLPENSTYIIKHFLNLVLPPGENPTPTMSFLAKFAASKYVGDKLEDNFGPQNPKYDIHPPSSANGRPKKTKKPLPAGLSPHDARVLTSLRRRAFRYEWWVDCHCCCGLHVQFGTVTLWGLLPVVGDVISLLNALGLVRAARRVDGGLPPATLAVMLLWAAVDFAIKLVPIVGDLVTAVVKPNTRNLMRVEAVLRRRGEERLIREAVGAGARAGVREPLLVVPAEQPEVRRGMSVGVGTAGPSYGTVTAVGAGAGAGAGGQSRIGGRTASRHLLPFWRKNEESDGEEEAEGRR